MRRFVRWVLGGLAVLFFGPPLILLVAINVGLFVASPFAYMLLMAAIVGVAGCGAALIVWAFEL